MFARLKRLLCPLGRHDWQPTPEAEELRRRNERQPVDEAAVIRFEVKLKELELECSRCGVVDEPFGDVETSEDAEATVSIGPTPWYWPL